MGLNELWNQVRELNRQHFPNNKLQPIMGGGCENSPEVMFVFINPTVRNISSSVSWRGPRYPFIGTKHVWRIFHRAGLFDDFLMSQIEKSKTWSVGFSQEVLGFLRSSGFYFTNIVKWTGYDATLPLADKISLFLPLLRKEIEIVKPKKIVTFGLIPFKALTGLDIRLMDYYKQVVGSGKLEPYVDNIVPCYFPVGRGDPKKAVEMLRLL